MTVEELDGQAVLDMAGRAADPITWPRGRGLHRCPPAAVAAAYLLAGKRWDWVHAGEDGSVWVGPPVGQDANG
jgi:hypothetical protein